MYNQPMDSSRTTRFTRGLLIALIFFLPLYYIRFSLGSVPTNLIEILIVIAAVLAFLQKPIREKLPKTFLVAAALMLAGIAIGVGVAADHRAALGIFKGWFVIPLLYLWSLQRIADNKTIKSMHWAICLNVLAVSLYAVLQNFGYLLQIGYQSSSTDFAQYIDQQRVYAIFESPNFLAMYLAPLYLLAAAFLWRRYKNILLTLAFSILPLAAIYFSGSRAGILALLAGAIVMVVWQQHKKLTLWLLVGLAAVSLGYFAHTPKAGTGDATRLYIWDQSVQLIRDHPVFGIGPGQLQTALNERVGDQPVYQQFVRDYALHSHNIFLTFWLSGGLLALAGFVLASWYLVRRVFLSKAQFKIAALAALMAILFHGLYDTTYFKNDLAIMFYLVAFLIMLPETDGAQTNERSTDS